MTTTTTTAATLETLTTAIDSEIRNTYYGKCDYNPEYEPEHELFFECEQDLKYIDDDPDMNSEETLSGYTPEGERKTEGIIAAYADKIARHIMPRTNA